MLAVFLSADAERFPIEDEDTVWSMRIRKNSARKIAMQGAHHRRVLSDALSVSYATIGAPVEHVAIVKCRGFLASSFLYPERPSASLALTASAAPENGFPGAAIYALFFMDELREG